MPARPSHTSTRTERVKGGRKQITEIICDRPDGSFIVAKALHGAGLMLWKDAQNYIFLQRFAMLGKGGKINPVAAFEEREAGHRGATHNLAIPPGAVFLRLERKGPRIIGAVSLDGVEWKALKPIDTTWLDGPIKVGLVAVNTSSGVNTVKFEGYSLKSK
jgi:regulation of enolase protein 1 (concanavalin A-like superfamily)